MTDKVADMMDDGRKISAIRSASGADPIAAIGRHGVTKIVAYGERGEYGYIPFLAVYAGDAIVSRWPGKECSIFYAGDTDA